MMLETILLVITDLSILIYILYFPYMVLKPKLGHKKVVIMVYLIFILISLFDRVLYNKTTPVRTIFNILSYGIYYCFAFEGKISAKLITLAVLEMYFGLFEVPFEILGLLYGNYILYENTFMIIINIFILTSAIIFSPLIKKSINKLVNKKFSTGKMIFLFVLALQVFVLLTLSYSAIKLQEKDYIFMYVLSIIAIIIQDFLIYKIIITNSKNYELKEQVRALELKNELDLKYYERIKKSIYETRKLNHDFNNILMILENNNFNNENEKNILLDEIKSLIKKNQIRNFCENELVNVIITNKFETIAENNIDFSANLNLSNDIPIKKLDLCRIFTNIMDNAIESCLSCKDKNGFIILTSKVENDYLYIKCENHCEILKQASNGKFISTKKGHKGLGTEILDNIAREYYGDFSSKYEDNIFTSLISLNIKTQL